jgi:hypothetical protein
MSGCKKGTSMSEEWEEVVATTSLKIAQDQLNRELSVVTAKQPLINELICLKM